jgi:hypothetical protein
MGKRSRKHHPMSIVNEARRFGPSPTVSSRSRNMTPARPVNRPVARTPTPAITADNTISSLVQKHLGTEIIGNPAFDESGWILQGVAPLLCPVCDVKHVLVARKHYTRTESDAGKRELHYWAVACRKCQSAVAYADSSPELPETFAAWGKRHSFNCAACHPDAEDTS